MKSAENGTWTTSFLVAQSYADKQSLVVSTIATRSEHFTQHDMLSIAASKPELKAYTSHVREAYKEVSSKLDRIVYVKAPK